MLSSMSEDSGRPRISQTAGGGGGGRGTTNPKRGRQPTF